MSKDYHNSSSDLAKQLSRDAVGLAARLAGLVSKWSAQVTGDSVEQCFQVFLSEFRTATELASAQTCLFEVDEEAIESAIDRISRCHTDLERLLTPAIPETETN